MDAFVFAQTDSTGQKITLIVFGLVAVAAALALLTAWYWRITDPARRGAPGGRRGPDARDPGGAPDGGSDNASGEPATEVVDADQTRILDRSQLSPDAAPKKPAEPDIIDLRHDAPAAAPETRPLVADPTGEIPVEAPPSDPTIIDVDAIEAARDAAGTTGAHDEGIDFEDWLALAEEDS